MSRALSTAAADADAEAIGNLYRRSRASLVESVTAAAEAGRRLAEKKASLRHGQWLPWLTANAEALGFDSPQTAQRLMRLGSNASLTTHLDPDTAEALSRETWGNRTPGRLMDPSAIQVELTELRTVMDNPDATIVELMAVHDRALTLQNDAAESALRAERELGKLLRLPPGVDLARLKRDDVIADATELGRQRRRFPMPALAASGWLGHWDRDGWSVMVLLAPYAADDNYHWITALTLKVPRSEDFDSTAVKMERPVAAAAVELALHEMMDAEGWPTGDIDLQWREWEIRVHHQRGHRDRLDRLEIGEATS